VATVSRTKTWVADETLTAAHLNAEFSGILTGINSNALDQTNLSKTDDYTFGSVIVGSGITSADSLLHVHSGSAGTIAAVADYNDVVVEGTTVAGMTILSGTSSTPT